MGMCVGRGGEVRGRRGGGATQGQRGEGAEREEREGRTGDERKALVRR